MTRLRANNIKFSKKYPDQNERLVRYIYKLISSNNTKHFSNNQIRYIILTNHKGWYKTATFRFVQEVRNSNYNSNTPKKTLSILKQLGYLK